MSCLRQTFTGAFRSEGVWFSHKGTPDQFLVVVYDAAMHAVVCTLPALLQKFLKVPHIHFFLLLEFEAAERSSRLCAVGRVTIQCLKKLVSPFAREVVNCLQMCPVRQHTPAWHPCNTIRNRACCRYLKHPVFMKYNLIALGTNNLVGINCGVVYSQNAHPAGPTSWAAFQVPERTMRWLENADYILQLLNSTKHRGKLQDIGFEQSVYNDAVWSIVAGRPVFAHSLRPKPDSGLLGEWERYHRSLGPDKVQTERVCPTCFAAPHAITFLISVEDC
jgi:hypothetical protein